MVKTMKIYLSDGYIIKTVYKGKTYYYTKRYAV